MGSREVQRFLAYTGLTAPPYNLRAEDLLRFSRGMTAGKLMRKLQKLVTWSRNCEVMRRAVLLSVGYKLREIEELEHQLVFDSRR